MKTFLIAGAATAGILSGAIGAGCRPTASTTPPPAPLSDGASVGYPGTLRPPAAMGPDVQWEQRVTATYDGRARSFDAVLSKAGQELLLIGLGPMKTPGFVVTLRDSTVEFENRSPEQVPFDPQYIMLDIQRVYFPWLPGAPPADGVRSGTIDGEAVTERYEGGHLVQRTFTRADETPPGAIVVDYRGWSEGADAPRTAVLDNGWFGYRLEIETVTQQRL